MIGKVKKWLGIEGVKVELVLPEEVAIRSGVVNGSLRFQSMNPQIVTGIRLVLIERYSRGRGEEKLTDEYLLGKVELNENFEVLPDEVVEREFALPFSLIKSGIDQFGDRNILNGGLATLAKWSRAVKSEYRIEVEARVKGVALNPFDKKSIVLK